MDRAKIIDYIKNTGTAEAADLQNEFEISYKDAKEIIDELAGEGHLVYSGGVKYSYISKTETAQEGGDRKYSISKFTGNYKNCFKDDDKKDDSDEWEQRSEALQLCIQMQQASVSFIQRRMPVGYIEACKLIDWMEEMGFISESNGLTPRRVLITQEEFDKLHGVSSEEVENNTDDNPVSAYEKFLKRRMASIGGVDDSNKDDDEMEAHKPPIIKVFGVGRTGIEVLDEITPLVACEAKLYGVDGDDEDLNFFDFDEKLLLTGDNDEDEKLLAEAVDGADVVIIAAGMGGKTGSKTASLLSKVAFEAGVHTAVVYSEPFPFEGEIRKNNFESNIEEIKILSDILIGFPCVKTVKVVAGMEDKSLIKAMEILDKHIAEAIEGLISYISSSERTSEIYDMFTASNGDFVYFGKAEANDSDEIEDAVHTALNNVLQSKTAQGVENIFVYVEADKLELAENISDITAAIKSELGNAVNVRCAGKGVMFAFGKIVIKIYAF